MFEGFNADHIKNIEFSFCVNGDDMVSFHQAPTDKEIKEQLQKMFDHTVDQLIDSENYLEKYEISEKYSAKESLIADISDNIFDSIHHMRDAKSTVISSDDIENPDGLSFYRVVYYDDNGSKVIGIKKASYFKSILKQRSRLIRLHDDSLKAVEDKIFKLDYDFDFFIYDNNAYILRPSNFESLAEMSDQIFDHVVEKVEILQETLKFINFNTIKEVSSKSKRAAKLVISISSREDLENTSEKK